MRCSMDKSKLYFKNDLILSIVSHGIQYDSKAFNIIIISGYMNLVLLNGQFYLFCNWLVVAQIMSFMIIQLYKKLFLIYVFDMYCRSSKRDHSPTSSKKKHRRNPKQAAPIAVENTTLFNLPGVDVKVICWLLMETKYVAPKHHIHLEEGLFLCSDIVN